MHEGRDKLPSEAYYPVAPQTPWNDLHASHVLHMDRRMSCNQAGAFYTEGNARVGEGQGIWGRYAVARRWVVSDSDARISLGPQ